MSAGKLLFLLHETPIFFPIFLRSCSHARGIWCFSQCWDSCLNWICVIFKTKSEVRKSVIQFWTWQDTRIRTRIRLKIMERCKDRAQCWRSWSSVGMKSFHLAASCRWFWWSAHITRIRMWRRRLVPFILLSDWKRARTLSANLPWIVAAVSGANVRADTWCCLGLLVGKSTAIIQSE